MMESARLSCRIAGRKCIFRQYGHGGPVIIWGMYPHEGNELEHMRELLVKNFRGENFLMIAYQIEDWNRDLSPWPAPAAFGKEDFAGGGPETLNWLKNHLVPFIHQTCQENPNPSDEQNRIRHANQNRSDEPNFVQEKTDKKRKIWLMGYSLAGLFSLWAAYETDCFDGIICCSGSLWMKDWKEYAASHHIAGPCDIYLSLGGKEEKTRNTMMATVGDRTREEERLLVADANVRYITLEWNKGGHFADSAERMLKGVRWMLDNQKSSDSILVQ